MDNENMTPDGKAGSSAAKAPKKKGKHTFLKALVIVFIVLLILGIAFFGLVHHKIPPFYIWHDSLKERFSNGEIDYPGYDPNNYIIPADAYYEANGRLISVTKPSKSENLRIGSDFVSDIKSRGFEDFVLYTEFDLDGRIHNASEIMPDSAEKYPIMEGICMLKDNSIWHLYEIDGALTAFPVSYISDHETQKQIIVSESEEIVSYDSVSGMFYRTVPNPDVLTVIVIDKITSDSLAALDISAKVGT